MDTLYSVDLEKLDLELARVIDGACRLFEQKWRAGESPKIEDQLAVVEGAGRPALLVELIALERELVGKTGVPPRIADYLVRFPGHEREVARAFGLSDQAVLASSVEAEAETIAPIAPVDLPATAISDAATLPPPRGLDSDVTTDPGTPATQIGPPDRPAENRAKVKYFGDYILEHELARGGMGIVYKARQVNLNRVVALKMILAGQLASEDDVKRFYLEAEAAANLDHPGIVPIYEVGQHEGQHYFSMGFVEGESLAQRLADGPLPPREAAALTVTVAEAIGYAHSRGVIHRDLKPGNILLDRNGNPRVTDFGLAKKLQGDSGLTGSGQIVGTPSYMPPEQAGGSRGEVGPAADVYALGAALYALITGRPPFQAATATDTVLQVLNDEPVPPRRLNASIPRDLETIVLKCLEKAPSKRYAGAAAMREDLRRYLAGEPIVARPVTRIERAVKWARRRPAIAGLAATLIMVLVVGFTGMALLWARAEDNAAVARTNEQTARQQTTIATDRAEALRRQDYVSRVNLAYRECLDNNVARAIERLDGCPADLRGWEWDYVSRQCHLDLQTYREPDPQTSVNAVAFSPDGRRIATGSGLFQFGGSGDLSVRDAATGREVFAHRGLPGSMRAMAYSPNGRWLAAGFGTTLGLWDAETGQERFRKSGGPLPINGLAFTPDGRRILAGCADWWAAGYAKLWDAETGEEQKDQLPGGQGGVTSVAVSPDGRRAALASSGRVDLWDLQARKPIRTLQGHDGFVYTVAFSPDGRYVASGGFDRTIRLWDAATGSEVRRYIGHEGFVRGLAFSPDAGRLVSCAEDKSLKLWSVDSDRELTTLHGHQHYVVSVAFSPDGYRIVSGGADHTAKLWFATSAPQLTFLGHNGWVNTVAFSPDGRRVASSSGIYSTAGYLLFWDPGTGEPIRTALEERSWINAAVFSPDGKALALSGRGQIVKVGDADTGRVRFVQRGRSKGGYEPTNVAFSPDGRRVAAVAESSSVKVLDAASGAIHLVLKEHADEVNGVAYSPDGRRLASCGSDKTVRVWDAETGREVFVLRGHEGPVGSLAFSPDGRRLASVGGIALALAEVIVWDPATGRELYRPRGHTDMVSAVVFSPDSRRLATGSEDRTIKLWDAADGQELFTLRGHSSGVLCVAFSPDGRRIVSGSIDRTAKVWDTGPPDADQLLRRIARTLVADRFRSLLLRSDAIEHIRRDPKLDETIRPLAIEIAGRYSEDPMALNNASWMIAREPGRTPEDYRRASRYAQAACRLAPQESTFVNTLGVARYRAGLYHEALADLTGSLKLNAPRFGGPIPADLAFIAMARHRLGQSAEARKTLEQLRSVMKAPRWSGDDESKAFLAEAAAQIDRPTDAETNVKPSTTTK